MMVKELHRFQEGVLALRQSCQQPLADLQELQKQQEALTDEASTIDRAKSEVLHSLSTQAVKCDSLDKSVEALKNILENAIKTINVRIDITVQIPVCSSW